MPTAAILARIRSVGKVLRAIETEMEDLLDLQGLLGSARRHRVESRGPPGRAASDSRRRPRREGHHLQRVLRHGLLVGRVSSADTATPIACETFDGD